MEEVNIKGLTNEEAETRYNNGKYNKPIDNPSKSVKQIVKDNVLTYFNFIFLLITVILILVGSFRDLTFLPIIITNTLIGIVQEIRSKKVLDELNMLNVPKTQVIRNGNIETLATDKLVLDDVVMFKAGDQIPADARIISGEVSVNESLLTGEEDEINKNSGSELLSGSFIVSGTCYAKLTKVGEDSYISKLTLEAKSIKNEEQSEIVKSLNKIVKFAGIAIIPIGITLFIEQYFFAHETLRDSVTSMVASVIGMIPEGLFLLASVTLAISAMKLARKKVLLHDMKSIETLARVDTLCVDKTGTITDGTMKVENLHPITKQDYDELFSLVSDFASNQSEDNITMAALKSYFNKPKGREVQTSIGFSSEFKYSAVNFKDSYVVIGAPEFVLKRDYDAYQNTIEEYSKQGLRTLVIALSSNIIDGKELKGKLMPLGFITLSNPIRKNAKETFRYFREQGVQIKVISGDNPVTVSNIALSAGIANAEDYVDASTLKSEDEIEKALLTKTVFGRVTPEQKRIFVRILKKNGRTVAMTGDGVNDVLALKDADCSIAMASGSEAARQASKLVLLDSDFAKMPEIVKEGRRVVNNLERSGSLFLVKNIFSFLTSVLAIYFGIKYPLEPSQVSLISMFTIGIPAFFLSQMPSTDLIKGNFAKNIIYKAMPGGIADTIMVALMVSYGMIFGVDTTDISTASTVLLAIIGLMVLYRISSPMNKYKWTIWSSCAGGLIISMIFFKDMFGLDEEMSLKGILLCANFSIMTEIAFRYVNKALDFSISFGRKIKKKLIRGLSY